MPAVSVVVPARGAADTLPKTLAALRDQAVEGGFEVVVVDNGSDDAIAAIARGAGPGVRLVRTQPLRAGAARNAGARDSTAPVLAFTDADCVPQTGWLEAGLAAMANADLVQGAVGPEAVAAGPFDRSVSVSGAALYETANLFVSRDVFDRVGGFEDWMTEDFERPFGEDVLFGWRAARTGARTAFSADARVSHAVRPRGAGGYVAERLRVRFFCALVRLVPELRQGFLYRRLFLSPRSARFDLAVAGVAAALVLGLTVSAVALLLCVLAIPYARHLWRRSLPWGRRAPGVALAELAADAATLVALVYGSLRWRTPIA
jgi:glycosyltransferase involved in cell wall biosynthesis